MKVMTVDDYIPFLVCPACFTGSLKLSSQSLNYVCCKNCARQFPYENHIINFLMQEYLDDNNQTEISGNRVCRNGINYTKAFMTKGQLDPVYNHFTNKKVKALSLILSLFDKNTVLFSLGSGSGYELGKLLPIVNFKMVFSSDICEETLHLVPVRLSPFEGQLAMFVSEFRHSPIPKNDSNLGLVYEALHHTNNIHTAIEALLQNNFLNLVLVEPTTNWFIEILAHFGLAKRREYSGTIPDWINIRKLKDIAKRRCYKLSIHTLWEFPINYLPNFFKKHSSLITISLAFVDVLSFFSRPFHFGNFCVVSLCSAKTDIFKQEAFTRKH